MGSGDRHCGEVLQGLNWEGKLLKLGGSLPTMRWPLDVKSTEEAFGWKFKKYENTMKELIGQYIELSRTVATV